MPKRLSSFQIFFDRSVRIRLLAVLSIVRGGFLLLGFDIERSIALGYDKKLFQKFLKIL